MELHEQNIYTIDDIQALIDNHAEEGVHLELKRANALSKENADKVTKTFRHSLILTEELLYMALLKITMWPVNTLLWMGTR